MSGRLRVFLIGLAKEDLGLLQGRSEADDALEIVGTALLQEVQHGTVRLPNSIDAIVASPAVWTYAGVSATSARGESRSNESLVEDLTARERDVLALVAEGRSNRDVAARLGISEHTVKFHLASLFGKLGVATRTQAVRRALDWGLLDI